MVEGVNSSLNVGDFYRESVLPALAQRLDRAFPEFGWRRDRDGWVATNQQHTHARLGVRADRIVAHGAAPPGFLIHGSEPMLWTAYVNGGTVPRGADFVRAVRQIAERAGVDSSALDRSRPRDRRAELLEAFFGLCRDQLAGDRGAAARSYLERRGFPREAITDSGLGVIPPSADTSRLLEAGGYRPTEVAAAGVLADSRWPGRLCGAWRDTYGQIGTLWARALVDSEAAGSRYLYLRGASRTKLPPYGLSDLLTRPADVRREIVLVEGFFDLHQLRARGIDNVAALGGTSISPKTFEQLSRFGIEVVTLCLDNDKAGRAATVRAIENAARTRQSPDLYVVDATRLAPAKDPDEFIRDRDLAAWQELVGSRSCGIAWRACELLRIGRGASELQRRAALRRAGQWLGSLPPRLALEQEDAVRLVAEQCGYSTEAALRVFRERYWSRTGQGRQPARCRGDERAVGLER